MARLPKLLVVFTLLSIFTLFPTLVSCESLTKHHQRHVLVHRSKLSSKKHNPFNPRQLLTDILGGGSTEESSAAADDDSSAESSANEESSAAAAPSTTTSSSTSTSSSSSSTHTSSSSTTTRSSHSTSESSDESSTVTEEVTSTADESSSSDSSSADLASASASNDKEDDGGGGLGKGTLIAIIVVASCVGGVLVVWTIIRKWKFSPSRRFEDKLNPIDFQPGHEDKNINNNGNATPSQSTTNLNRSNSGVSDAASSTANLMRRPGAGTMAARSDVSYNGPGSQQQQLYRAPTNVSYSAYGGGPPRGARSDVSFNGPPQYAAPTMMDPVDHRYYAGTPSAAGAPPPLPWGSAPTPSPHPPAAYYPQSPSSATGFHDHAAAYSAATPYPPLPHQHDPLQYSYPQQQQQIPHSASAERFPNPYDRVASPAFVARQDSTMHHQ